MSILNVKGRISIELMVKGERYRYHGLGDYYVPQDMAKAIAVEAQLKVDLKAGNVYPIEHYYPNLGQVEATASGKLSIQGAWANYQKLRFDEVSDSTKKSNWAEANRLLSLGDPNTLTLKQIRTTMADSCIRVALVGLMAALNYEAKRGATHLAEPLNKFRLWKEELREVPSGRSGRSYSEDEALAIVSALETNRFCAIKARVKHSFYVGFVKFLFLSGARPGEVIALEWTDVVGGDKPRAVINKTYSNRQLRTQTKTGEVRSIPLTGAMIEAMGVPKTKGLVFPSPEGSFIDINNFTGRILKKVVQELHRAGELKSPQLRTYNLRHTRTTLWQSSNKLSEAQIAALQGTSVEMLRETYSDRDRLRDEVDVNLIR